MREVRCTTCMWFNRNTRAEFIAFRDGKLPYFLCPEHARLDAATVTRIAPISDRMRANIVEGRNPYAHRPPTSTTGE